MTAKIVEAVKTPRNEYNGQVHALHYAVGALVAYDTAKGISPYEGIDVERLFSAIEMLSDRDNLEVSPFVANWSAAIDAIDAWSPQATWVGNDIVRGVNNNDTRMIERALERMVESFTSKADPDSIFRNLQQSMMSALVSLAQVDDSRLEYLGPLLDAKSRPIRIATLNYDLSIETLARTRGMNCDTGIDSWLGGRAWTWREEADVHLLKLHGSIDWVLDRTTGAGGMDEYQVKSASEDEEGPRTPALVFGARGKVRADGPFLAMLAELERSLEVTEDLLIVGYSFRDDHINTALNRWINLHPDGRLTIINPDFYIENETLRFRSDTGYVRRLCNAMAERNEGAPQPMFRIAMENASTGLAEVLT